MLIYEKYSYRKDILIIMNILIIAMFFTIINYSLIQLLKFVSLFCSFYNLFYFWSFVSLFYVYVFLI